MISKLIVLLAFGLFARVLSWMNDFKYRSNRSFNMPPPRAYPGHLTPLPPRGGGNLIIRVFQGVGNLNCTLDFM